jgi:DNA-binding YbaB/EbfC family protein
MSDSGPDLNELLKQAQAMQQQLVEAQSAISDKEVTGDAGGGAVRIVATGGLEFRAVTIDPAAVNPSDVPMLEDLILAALNDTVAKANALNSEAIGGLGGLGNLLGGG